MKTYTFYDLVSGKITGTFRTNQEGVLPIDREGMGWIEGAASLDNDFVDLAGALPEIKPLSEQPATLNKVTVNEGSSSPVVVQNIALGSKVSGGSGFRHQSTSSPNIVIDVSNKAKGEYFVLLEHQDFKPTTLTFEVV